ncbi:MAG: diguanylate cyclase domain-containing protein [Aeromonadaceae bacterium]
MHRVRRQLLLYLYANGSFGIPALAVLTLYVSYFCHDWVPSQQLYAWMVTMLLSLLVRSWHLWWRRQRNNISLAWLDHEYFVAVTISAILWGMGLMFFMSHLPVTLRMMLTLLSCMYMAAAGILLLSSSRCYYGVVIPIGGALLLELGSQYDEQRLGIMLSVSCILLFITLIRRRLSHWQIEGLYHRYTNAHMAQELRKTSEYLRLASQLDGLTAIANRARFDKALETAWRRCNRAQAPLSLILLDVDFFKQFNDKYGHQAGDECLRRVAGLLPQVLRREDDLAARYGGEEFVLLLPFTDQPGALQVAQALQKGLAELAIPHGYSEVGSCVTCSMGLARLVPSIELVPSDLVAMADVALYRAKKNGRARIEIAD